MLICCISWKNKRSSKCFGSLNLYLLNNNRNTEFRKKNLLGQRIVKLLLFPWHWLGLDQPWELSLYQSLRDRVGGRKAHLKKLFILLSDRNPIIAKERLWIIYRVFLACSNVLLKVIFILNRKSKCCKYKSILSMLTSLAHSCIVSCVLIKWVSYWWGRILTCAFSKH